MASASSAGERLRRLLILVPYVVRRPATPISELTELFGVSRDDLLRDLNLLLVSGAPPYSPGDLIDVDIEDDLVTITMADYFARPLRLTRAEATALFLRGTAMRATLPDADTLASALDKLAAGLGPDVGELPQRVEAMPGGVPEALEPLRSAAAQRRRVRITYHATSSGETTEREIEPEEIFSQGGHWYVAAWDRLRDAERLFRIDRIDSCEMDGEVFEPRGLSGAGRPLYTVGEDDTQVLLRLSPTARWVAEYYESTDVREDDGALIVSFPAGRLEWVERLLLRLGGEAEVLAPEGLRSRVRELAASALSLYR